MGKIFGISDLPVTIFTTPLQQPKLPDVKVTDIETLNFRKKLFMDFCCDEYIKQQGYKKIKHLIGNVKK